jgi:hypothetical protein
MQTVRRIGAGFLWVAAFLLGLVSVVLCLTIILLPLGLPLLLLAGRLFRIAMRLWAPRAVSHPVDEAGQKMRATRTRVAAAARTRRKGLGRRARRVRRRLSS